MFSPFQKKKGNLEQQAEDGLSMRRVPEDSPAEASGEVREPEVSVEPAGSMLGNKTHMDKKSLDLIFAVEQMIQAKQHVEMSHNDLQDRLSHANGQIDRLGRDLKNLNKVIEEREKSILELEQKLTDKNLKVDQIMEDYRELHSTLSGEIEELKSVIEIEHQKYAALLQKHNETLSDKNKKISDLEEKNVKLEIELSHMKQKFEALRQEKTHLVNIVNDFTSRMTSPLASNSSRFDEASSE